MVRKEKEPWLKEEVDHLYSLLLLHKRYSRVQRDLMMMRMDNGCILLYLLRLEVPMEVLHKSELDQLTPALRGVCWQEGVHSRLPYIPRSLVWSVRVSETKVERTNHRLDRSFAGANFSTT